MLPSEIELLLTDNAEEFLFGKHSARPESVCPFFEEPFCSVYQKRPVDCRTYPVSIDLEGEKVVYVIDMNCPAVRKGLVSKRFIQHAIRARQENMPNKEWIREYVTKDEPRNYEWMTIEKYKAYRKLLV